MAHEKQGWKETLQAAKSKGSRFNSPTDPGEKKKQAQIMYKKRKLDKQIKDYVNTHNPIKYKEILKICGTT